MLVAWRRALLQRFGLGLVLWLTACGSRSGLELAGGGAGDDASDSGDGAGGRVASGGSASVGGASGGQATGGQTTGGTSAGGASGGRDGTGGGEDTGGRGSGAEGSGGEGSGGAGACPDGFVDLGDGCQPILLDLTSNFGGISPPVGPLERSFEVTVPLWTNGLTLVPTVAGGVTVDWDGTLLGSGESWRPPGTSPDELIPSELSVFAPGMPATPYEINLRRLGRLDYLKASNPDEADNFGSAVALSADGRTLAVGAIGEDSAALGIGGDQDDDSDAFAGAVYVFVRVGESWVQQAYIKASNTGMGDRFGEALDLSADGSVLLVGAYLEGSATTGIGGDGANDLAPDSGAAYVFSRSGEAWHEEAYVKASSVSAQDRFGQAVALSGDGTTFAVGAPWEDGGATGVNGDVDEAASDSGAVYVFSRATGGITQEAYIKASNTGGGDRFGAALDLSHDGNVLVVGAPNEDSLATGIDGDQGDAPNPLDSNAGAAYAFARQGGTWAQAAYIKASDADRSDQFGEAIALSGNGSMLAVGAPDEGGWGAGVDAEQEPEHTASAGVGAVYVFERSAGSFTERTYIKASNVQAASFGASLALSFSGDVLSVGARGEAGAAPGIDGDQTSSEYAEYSGAAYRFERTATSWVQAAYIKPPDIDENDFFGRHLALSSDGAVLAVGASDDSSAVGVNGDLWNEDLSRAGAVFVFAEE